MTVKKIMVGFILLLACAGFIYGVWSAFSYSFCKGKDPAEMPDFPIQVVTVIGGVLATNLGAVLGIKIETAKKVGFKAKDFFSIQSSLFPNRCSK